MNIFSQIASMIRQVIHKMIPYKSIAQVENVDTTLSSEMENALDIWHNMYVNKSPWVDGENCKSMNLAAFISSEIARQVVLEMKWNITGKAADGSTADENGNAIMNPRAEYLKAEFEKIMRVLRQKLEQGCAAGGMIIKPYANQDNGHIYFDFIMDWGLYPLAFDDDGNLADVILPDRFTEGKTYYTRLERHTVTGENVRITQKVFRSDNEKYIGSEIKLSEVERWASLEPEVTIQNTDGPLFGWYRTAAANNIDVDCPLGASVFSKAVDSIKEADKQYSRLLWEFEGGELALDVDPTALRPNARGNGYDTAHLKERLFRAVDIDKGDRDLYEVFAPALRDASFTSGLNTILKKIEDQCGLSRGTMSDETIDARTATELVINKQRSYATISDNQTSLETCLTDVIRVMDKYASIYHLAPEGEFDVSFDWDDSIITDTAQQMNERMSLFTQGIIGKEEFRQWYFGETAAQAHDAIAKITTENVENMAAMNTILPTLQGDGE